MENFGLGGGATLLGVFLLCTCVGIIAGNYIKSQTGTANASSANITVVNNNQISTIDQGTGAILRTSTVTIKDGAATLGYRLTAQISQNTITGSTATIYPTTPPQSPTTSPCTQSSPCTLNPSTPTQILETTNTTATEPQGHTTDWTVTITLPTNTPQGNYLLDIAYSEEAIAPPTISDMTYMQDLPLPENTQVCTNTPDRTRTTLKDRRNNQDYYIEKIGNLCWMETNLRYAGYDGTGEQWNSAWNYPDDRYATTTSAATTTANINDNARPMTTVSGNTASAFTVAQLADPGGSTTLDTTTPTNNTTFYGYLYNWCAAMGGQYGTCNNNTPVMSYDHSLSICPAGWRLPTGHSAGEFQAMLNAIGDTPASVATLRNNFLAVYSGFYKGNLNSQGSLGGLWTESLYNENATFAPRFDENVIYATDLGLKSEGYAVRCVTL